MDQQQGGCSRSNLLGISVDPLTMSQAVSRCAEAVEKRSYLSIGMVNAAKLVAMRTDDRLRGAVTGCELVLADGQSIVWASRLLGSPVPERVAGIDLFQELLSQAGRQSGRVFFLGARQAVLDAMLEQLRLRYPRLTVAGARHGYFQPGDEAEIADTILRSGTDMLFVGMSSPGKELFMSEWGRRTGAAVVHGVGGSFDVLGGLTRRAPAWYQEHGLEWLYRTWQEPRRLGRRYLRTNAAFLTLVAREAIRVRARPPGR
jgi:N-acetylglucosaminyldiphosphoundecaprenol N-acetyl-beta-D-mannosaminyltransferase